VGRTRAWFLNFDADMELERPAGYTPPRAVAARAAELAGRVGPLLGPGDVLLREDPPAGAAPLPRGLAGRAWCPTPRALRALSRAGVELPRAPALEVLRRVNHRRFCAELGQTLPGARYADTLGEVEEAIAGGSPAGEWVLKRPFGFAGRGQRRVAAGALDADARRWVEASIASGEGVQVEPWVARRGDCCSHGYIAPGGGAIALGAPCVQICDARGAWRETRRAGPSDLDPGDRQRLLEAAREAGEALAAAGYFGPFGIDGFRWVGGDVGVLLCPRCEINARYTMGWAIGMGDLRPDLE
jgi:hypothetical protein